MQHASPKLLPEMAQAPVGSGGWTLQNHVSPGTWLANRELFLHPIELIVFLDYTRKLHCAWFRVEGLSLGRGLTLVDSVCAYRTKTDC